MSISTLRIVHFRQIFADSGCSPTLREDSNSLSGGEIAGIIFAVVALVAFCVPTCLFLCNSGAVKTNSRGHKDYSNSSYSEGCFYTSTLHTLNSTDFSTSNSGSTGIHSVFSGGCSSVGGGGGGNSGFSWGCSSDGGGGGGGGDF